MKATNGTWHWVWVVLVEQWRSRGIDSTWNAWNEIDFLIEAVETLLLSCLYENYSSCAVRDMDQDGAAKASCRC